MILESREPYYFSGVEDVSFTSKEGSNVSYFRYTFISDDEKGRAVTIGSRKALLGQGFNKFEICYPVVELSFSKEGLKINVIEILKAANE